jgi:outer membrane protein assembly factor BamB
VIVATDAGSTELIVNGTGTPGGGQVVAYDPASGQELWRLHGTTDVVCPTPIVEEGLVFCTSGRNGPILALRPGADPQDGRLAWSASRGGPYVPTGLAMDGRLYLLDDAGQLSCYDCATGKQVASGRLRGKFTASLIAGGGKLFAANEDGVVYVLTANEELEILAANRMDERITATPALSRGELFLRTARQLYCVRRPAESAEPDAPGEQIGQPHAVGKVIVEDTPRPSPSPSDALLTAPGSP